MSRNKHSSVESSQANVAAQIRGLIRNWHFETDEGNKQTFATIKLAIFWGATDVSLSFGQRGLTVFHISNSKHGKPLYQVVHWIKICKTDSVCPCYWRKPKEQVWPVDYAKLINIPIIDHKLRRPEFLTELSWTWIWIVTSLFSGTPTENNGDRESGAVFGTFSVSCLW